MLVKAFSLLNATLFPNIVHNFTKTNLLSSSIREDYSRTDLIQTTKECSFFSQKFPLFLFFPDASKCSKVLHNRKCAITQRHEGRERCVIYNVDIIKDVTIVFGRRSNWSCLFRWKFPFLLPFTMFAFVYEFRYTTEILRYNQFAFPVVRCRSGNEAFAWTYTYMRGPNKNGIKRL